MRKHEARQLMPGDVVQISPRYFNEAVRTGFAIVESVEEGTIRGIVRTPERDIYIRLGFKDAEKIGTATWIPEEIARLRPDFTGSNPGSRRLKR